MLVHFDRSLAVPGSMIPNVVSVIGSSLRLLGKGRKVFNRLDEVPPGENQCLVSNCIA